MSSAETSSYQSASSVIVGSSKHKEAAAAANSIYTAIIDRLGCVGDDDQDNDEARLKILNTIQSQRYPQHMLTLLSDRLIMTRNDSACASNCSGHGDCYDGTCFCQVSDHLPSDRLTF